MVSAAQHDNWPDGPFRALLPAGRGTQRELDSRQL